MAKEQLEYAKKTKLYDCLYETLNECLTERPKDVVDTLEAYFKKKGREKRTNHSIVSEQAAAMKTKLFTNEADDKNQLGGDTGEDLQFPLRNIVQSAFLFEQAGIGVGRDEQLRILLALKQLALEQHANEIRFWGKVFGIHADYFIAEVELMDDRVVEEEDDIEEQIQEKNDTSDGPEECDRLPKSTWQPPPTIPAEPTLTGTNRKVYFVCNEPGGKWNRLPNVTPAQIVCSREITKLLTGCLATEICSYPPFPGNEGNYLRSLIARIAASTHISPIGYYSLPGEEDDDEMYETFFVNPEFEGLSSKELANPTMCNWVHHTQYILQQGRCTWFDPYVKINPEDDFEEPDDEDEESPTELVPRETGPQILTSVALDSSIDSTQAWSVKLSSQLLPSHGVTIARSNRWPGAYTVSKGKIFENIYIGWGTKYSHGNFNPVVPGLTAAEYVKDEFIAEFPEPTLEMERLAKELNGETLEVEHASDTDDN